ncbi:MAG: NAD(P)H-hydrate dehydratase [Rhodospirillales bacterium]|nr:NAD(P)H-hydrate dehydratase [Xanthobacteraceae bacterium]MCW5698879.1 NAD(P)H-hydrate dehydratase [Rhodospirillales bacterium]
MYKNVLLTVAEMYAADAAAAASGVPTLDLMEAAGTAIAREIRRRWRPRRTVILCGPGNNGGDGFVVARLLESRGWPIRVGMLGDVDKLKGDAAVNAKRWSGAVDSLTPDLLSGEPLVVDALFGAGLVRPVDGVAAETVKLVNERGLDCVAVDIPSGIHGDTGEVLGVAPRCGLTVTFFRPKPGHVLLPGRSYCGRVVVADIGIPEVVLGNIRPRSFVNGPSTWAEGFPRPSIDGNKYSRGHAVIGGGDTMTGAARLAAEGARRIGAGLVTITCPPKRFNVYAAGRPGTLVAPVESDEAFANYISDSRRNAVLLGPGAGVSEGTRQKVESALRAQKACVLDADAITVFANDPSALFDRIQAPCVMTPHNGEFARIFQASGDKPARARAAAKKSGATILLKGADSVIAAPDGRVAINVNAPPDLATAGSGDVLAGMVVGLLAQGVAPFEAACAATWVHGAAARFVGPGLIAEDLCTAVPRVLKQLRDFGKQTAE